MSISASNTGGNAYSLGNRACTYNDATNFEGGAWSVDIRISLRTISGAQYNTASGIDCDGIIFINYLCIGIGDWGVVNRNDIHRSVCNSAAGTTAIIKHHINIA